MGSHHHPADGTPRHDALAARYMLANWIALIAEDHGWDAEAVARLAHIAPEEACAILDGAVVMTPAPMLDDVLRHLERRPH